MNYQRRASSRLGRLIFISLLLISNFCRAGGLYIPLKGTVGIGTANAGGSAKASDGSTVYFNPAGMTELERTAQFGVDFLGVNTNVSNAGSTAATPGTLGNALPYIGSNGGEPDSLAIVPNLYIVHPMENNRIWLGLAVTSPFGAKLDYPSKWFGRYDSLLSELITIDIAPSIAYKINEDWSIGGGIDIQYADATLTSALPNPLTPGGPTTESDAFSALTGDTMSIGYNLGLTWQPSERSRLGFHYRSGMQHNLNGSVTVSGLMDPLAAFNGETRASTSLDLPFIISLGLAQKLSDKLTLYLETTYFGWDSFDEIRVKLNDGSPDIVRPQNSVNTHAYATGINYASSDQWEFRAGIQFDETPATDLWRNTSLPYGDLLFGGMGVTHHLNNGISIDLAYVYTIMDKTAVDLAQPAFAGTPLQSVANIRGNTDNNINTLSLSLRYKY